MSSGETLEIRSLPAPIECQVYSLIGQEPPNQPSVNDSYGSTTDGKVLVLPLPSPAAVINIRNGFTLTAVTAPGKKAK